MIVYKFQFHFQYANAQNPKDNFTFKCHRSNGVTNGFQVSAMRV